MLVHVLCGRVWCVYYASMVCMLREWGVYGACMVRAGPCVEHLLESALAIAALV